MIHKYIIEELMLELEEFIPVKSRYWDGPRDEIAERYDKYIKEVREW